MKQAWMVRLGWLVVGVASLLPLTLTSGQRLDSNGAKRWLDEQGLRDRFPASLSPRFSASPFPRFPASPSPTPRSRQAHSQNVKLIGFIGGPILDVFVRGNLAYCASEHGLSIFDVSNPNQPRKLGDIFLPYSAESVYVSGSYAYVAAGDADLRVIDVSDPRNPREVGSYDTPGYAEDVYVSGSYAYVANYEAGLFILRFTGAVNHPPRVPDLLYPVDGATVSPTPTFKVKGEDPDGDQVKFVIEVTSGNQAKTFETSFFASGSEASYTVPSNRALSAGQWSWRAKAIDSQGAQSGWSSPRTFTVDVTNQPPSVPVLLAPAANATVSPAPTFRLKADDPDNDEVKFRIEMRGANITKVAETGFVASGSEATYTLNQPLTDGQWVWKAKAIDKRNAESGWSGERTFTVSSNAPDLVAKDFLLKWQRVAR